jgi:hypothetical protein
VTPTVKPVKPSTRRSRRPSRARRWSRNVAALACRVSGVAGQLGAREWHFYIGVAIAAAGGVQISIAWTLVALGVSLAVVGLRGVR